MFSIVFRAWCPQPIDPEAEIQNAGRLFLAQMPTVLMQSMHCAQVPLPCEEGTTSHASC